MPLPVGYASSQRQSTPKGLVRAFSWIRKQVWTNPATLVTNGYLTALAGPNAITITPTLNGSLVVGGVGVADFARNVVITVTHGAAVVALSGVITGTDINGRPVTEAWSVTAGGVTKTFTGAKAFKRVTSVTVVAVADASTDTIIIGSGAVLGLDTANGLISGVKETSAGAVVTTGVLLGASTAAAADRYGTYTPAAAPNGATTYQLWYLVDDLAATG